MKTPLAWLNLVHHKRRTAVAAAGVAVAVVLIFMQLGGYGAAEAAATIVYDELNFDVLLVSAQYVDFYHPGTVPRGVTYLPLGVPGVRKVMPLYVGSALWRNPDTGRQRRMMLLGFDLNEPVFRRGRRNAGAAIARYRAELQKPDCVLVDRLSRRAFGDLAGDMRRGGIETDLGARRVTVAGLFALGTGFGIDGQALCSDTNLSLIRGGPPPDSASMGLVLLEPGASAETVAAELRTVLPPDVRALTRRDVLERERRHWVGNTALGVILALGVGVTFAAGVVFVYQVIAADVRGRLPEYAMLQALGYPTQYLSGVVVRQALLMAVAGYVPGLLVSLGLYALARGTVGIPISMHWQSALVVLALTAAMCGLSGLFAVRKLRSADPADLFS
jgi:putative ABC transport system permease protein